jgi:DNA-binding HxlR family transcriptional regulator
MQKYKQYCPVARASEILADRWTPLIVRELILGSHRFNEIERGLPGISRSLLASRLRDLEDAGVVERLPSAQSNVAAYHLSEAGRDLKTVIETLGAWGVRWAFGEPRPEELDAGLLVWRIHQRINRELLPERRTVVEFDFTGPRARRGVVAARATGGFGMRHAPWV